MVEEIYDDGCIFFKCDTYQDFKELIVDRWKYKSLKKFKETVETKFEFEDIKGKFFEFVANEIYLRKRKKLWIEDYWKWI